MIYKYDLAIVTPTNNSANLARLVHQLEYQSFNGISVQFIIVNQCENIALNTRLPANDIYVIKTDKADFGCRARDIGILEANAQYISFWDDDNIYYPHAAISQYLTSFNNDIGIVNVLHKDIIIPDAHTIKPGYIDTMCFSVCKELAVKAKWDDGYGRYSDYRYLSKLLSMNPKINFSKTIIGYHL